MKIFLGSTNSTLRKRATEWLRKGDDTVLKELEVWGRRKEADWGDCYIFIEVDFPRFRNPRKQIDLIVSFDERVAICELKRGYFRNLNAREIVEQIADQEENFQEFLHNEGLAIPFSKVLACPALVASELDLLRQSIGNLHGAPHIQTAGFSEKLRNIRCSGGRPYHIISVLESSLAFHEASSQDRRNKVQQCIERVLTEGGRSLAQYANANDTLAALRSFARSPYVSFPAGHIEGTREAEFQVALEKLRTFHLLELSGPPEIGKSVMSRELIRELQLPYYELPLSLERSGPAARRHDFSSFEGIGRFVEETIDGIADLTSPDTNIARRLAQETAVFWFKSYEEEWRRGLQQFLDMLMSIKSSPQAYWIIESRSALHGHSDIRVELGAMNRAALARLLMQHSPNESIAKIEEAIDLSLGNPGVAIRVLTGNGSFGVDPRGFGWFANHLNPIEKRVLTCVCFAMERSPLGLSAKLVNDFVAAVHTDLPGLKRREAIDGVLGALRDAQLADLSPFTARVFGGLLDEIVPAGTEFVFVNSVDARLIASVMKQVDKMQTDRLSGAFERVLVEAASPGNLAEVTYELCTSKNLEPFMRSSFRFLSLGQVIDWIDSSDWHPPDARQAYLLKALRLLATLNQSPIEDLESELNTLDPRDPSQCFARDLIRARSMTTRAVSVDFDYAGWRKAADQIRDMDLRVAMYMSASTRLYNGGRRQEAWNLLTDVEVQFPPDTTAGTLLRYDVANYINRKQGRAIADEEDGGAAAWTRSCSRSLIESGLRFENIHLICAGLFYYARAAEFLKGRTEFRAVLGYLSALDWIEHVPRARARWRMRILLTRGSIHRHFVRADGLTWKEFAIHLDAAWADYTRAFLSAYRLRYAMHALNSLAYSMKLCRTAFRYRADPEAHSGIQKYVQEALERCDLVRRDIVRTGPEVVNIWANIERGEPILLYIASVAATKDEDAPLDRLADRWSRYVDLVLTVRSAGDYVAVDDVFKDLCRGFQFAESLSSVRHLAVFKRIGTHTERLLQETGPRRVGQRPRPLWSKLRELVTRYQRSAEDSL